MIKFRATTSKTEVIGLCLLPGNLKRLQQKKPIRVNLQEMGFPINATILIFLDEDTDKLMKQLTEFGFDFDEKTKLNYSGDPDAV